MTNLIKYIQTQGGILSGKLAEQIASSEGISDVAARKRVERIEPPIHKLTGLFSDNQSFLYHSDNYNSSKYFEKLRSAFQSSAKRCYSLIVAINYHHGLILKSELANYSFSPIANIKGHQKFSTLIEKLVKISVLIEYDQDHYTLPGPLSTDYEINFRHFKAVQFSKSLLLNQFREWSRNIGLVSYQAGKFNHDVGGFQFAFAAPSYINGLVQYKESKPMPGFVVVDILIGNSTSGDEIEFFLQKISAIRASNKTIRLFPVLLVDGVESSAFSKLKKLGVLVASVREIFGENYNDLLKSLINTITNAGAILKRDPEVYINLMDQMTKLVQGKTNNLRGDLFELAVGYYYGKLCQSLDVGKKVLTDDGKHREIDVLAVFEGEVRIVECKGHNYAVGMDIIDKYISEKIPSIRKWLLQTFPGRALVFEIWSTGGFTPEAEQALKKSKDETRKYNVDYLAKEDILARARKLQTSKFTDILREYYFKELV